MSKEFEDAAREVAFWSENESGYTNEELLFHARQLENAKNSNTAVGIAERSRPIQVTHCIDCKYWDTLENGNGWCKCPRVFPGKTAGTITARIGFYLTSENDFCSQGDTKDE